MKTAATPPDAWRGATAIFPTKHGKERVVAPVLAGSLGLVVVRVDVDTDRFGTFSRETPRRGSALDAARAKIAAAFEARPEATIAIASEGSFGPDPALPLLPLDEELLVLRDRERDLELVAVHRTHQAVHGHAEVTSLAQALAFAERTLDDHALVAIAADGSIEKGIGSRERLTVAVERGLALGASVRLEIDLRAHQNATRRLAIEQAARALSALATSRCPACGRPGWRLARRAPGLPCSECGAPTPRARAETFACDGCGHHEERAPSHGLLAGSPAECPSCNP